MEPAVEELYDLASDPHQERNLVSDPEQARVLERLRQRWERMRVEVE
jgi:arylsulfatase A-like enzyme